MNNKILQSAFLFAGTAIGAGMLALPLATGVSGFIPSCIFIILWFTYSLMTMYVILECIGYQKVTQTSGFMSMSEQFSGPYTKILIRLCYMLLLYAVTSAYIIGGGQLISNISDFFDCHISVYSSSLLFSIFFSIIAIQRVYIVGVINQWMMILLLSSFGWMIYSLIFNVNLTTLSTWDEPLKLVSSATIIVLSFACHNLLPTIVNYLNGDAFSIRRAIGFGMLLPLSIYLLWNAMIIGVLPISGSGSLLDIQQNHMQHGGELAMLAKALYTSGNSLDKLFIIFSLCAITTSYMGVLLSLKDFIIQAFQLHGRHISQLSGMLMVYLPTVLFALCYPHGFSMVLGYAGLIVAYIFGLAPILWAWKARYTLKITSEYPSGFSSGLLIVLGCFSLIIILIQIHSQFILGA